MKRTMLISRSVVLKYSKNIVYVMERRLMAWRLLLGSMVIYFHKANLKQNFTTDCKLFYLTFDGNT
jgi:hypothetical protein